MSFLPYRILSKVVARYSSRFYSSRHCKWGPDLSYQLKPLWDRGVFTLFTIKYSVKA